MVGRRRQQPARGGKQERQRSVMFTLLVFVRMAAPVNHAQNSTNLRDRRQQADSDIAAAFIKTFQDLRRPDTNGAKRIGKAKMASVYISTIGVNISRHRLRCCMALWLMAPSG